MKLGGGILSDLVTFSAAFTLDAHLAGILAGDFDFLINLFLNAQNKTEVLNGLEPKFKIL